jgi:hypothetical protein
MEVTMHRTMFTGPVIFSFTLLFVITLFAVNPVFAGSAAINCQAHEGACSLPLGTETVTLDIAPKPVTAMQDSTFTVNISGNRSAQTPYLDLGMPAMKMGPNRVMLKPDGNGNYTGKGVIVRCKSGRRTWFANVVVPGAGEAKFVFDVVY